MKINYYIGVAKPKACGTWLPFGHVASSKLEKVVPRMIERFDEHVGNNNFQNVREWEFAVASLCIIDSSITDGAEKQWTKIYKAPEDFEPEQVIGQQIQFLGVLLHAKKENIQAWHYDED